jgi:hypothetical protein
LSSASEFFLAYETSYGIWTLISYPKLPWSRRSRQSRNDGTWQSTYAYYGLP